MFVMHILQLFSMGKSFTNGRRRWNVYGAPEFLAMVQ